MTQSQPLTILFADVSGSTKLFETRGDVEARRIVGAMLGALAEVCARHGGRVIKTIGDEVMVVSPDPATLTEWAAGFLALFQERPQPRVGIHYGAAVFRDGDYFGGDVNLTHRVVNRALGGEVLVTQALVEAVDSSDFLRFDAIGEVVLKGFPEPISLYIARASAEG